MDSSTPFNLLVVPGSPAVVEKLAPSDTAGRHLVASVRALAGTGDTGARPIDIVGSRDERWRTGIAGSFRAWGSDVTVGGGHFLAELVARYCLGPAEARVRDSRGTLAPFDPTALTVLVLDGSAGMTPRAPLALIDAAPATHHALRDFLAGAGPLPADLAERGVIEPQLWEELAALAVHGLRVSAQRVIADDASLGIGRFVAAWQVDHV